MELTGSFVADLELLLSVGILLCLFLYLVVRLPAIGLACFMFLVLTRAHEYIPHSEVFRPSVLVGMIMLIGLFFHLAVKQQPLYFTGTQSWLFGAFIVLCLILLFFKGQTMYDRSGRLLIEPLLLVGISFFATLNAVRNFRDFQIILITLALIGVTISLLTLVQSFVTGIVHGRGWVYMGEQEKIIRAGSLGIDPNEVAATLATLLPLFFFLFDSENRSALRRLFYLWSIPLAILTIFLTYSRGGFLCFIAALFLIFIKRLQAKYVIGLAVLLILIFVLVPSTFWERLVSTGTTDTTGEGRVLIYQAAINMIQANPLTGIGYGQFYYLFGRYTNLPIQSYSSQNTFFGIAAETGLINLLIFLGLFAVTFLDLRRLKREAAYDKNMWMIKISDALTATLIITLISGLTLDRRMWVLIYIALALVVVLKRIWRQAPGTTALVTPGIMNNVEVSIREPVGNQIMTKNGLII
jgi:O-antigen ligase